MNNVVLYGELTKDPAFKLTEKNYPIASVVIAVNKKEVGTTKKANFINCKFLGENANIANNHLRKGDKILLNGEIQTSEYTSKGGECRLWFEVVVSKFEIIGAAYLTN